MRYLNNLERVMFSFPILLALAPKYRKLNMYISLGYMYIMSLCTIVVIEKYYKNVMKFYLIILTVFGGAVSTEFESKYFAVVDKTYELRKSCIFTSMGLEYAGEKC